MASGADSAHAGTKRPHSEDTSSGQPLKKRKVKRRLLHVQQRPQHVEPATQDPVFVQGQLLRSISAALAMVGFDSVKPTALEMFRGCVEEYMLHFLHSARTSMQTSRRTAPTPQDFTSALASLPNASIASLLSPQLELSLPEAISYPPIPTPDSEPPSPPSFTHLLQPLMPKRTPAYIPSHFPHLPPQHAWMHTPVFPEREHDARKMRERATEEGILAERALRKLAAAAKTGAVRAEKRKLDTLSGPGRVRAGSVQQQQQKRRGRRGSGAGEEMFGNLLKEVGGGREDDAADADEAIELSGEGVKELREDGVDVGMPEGVVVNWDMGGWRRGGRKHLRL